MVIEKKNPFKQEEEELQKF